MAHKREVELWKAYEAGGSGWDQGSETPIQDAKVIDGLDEAEQVRYWTTEKLRNLIRNLEPYVNGTFGTVSTKHGQLYMAAVRELNRVWSATYEKPQLAAPEVDQSKLEEAVREEARMVRARVLDQLDELRTRTRQGP